MIAASEIFSMEMSKTEALTQVRALQLWGADPGARPVVVELQGRQPTVVLRGLWVLEGRWREAQGGHAADVAPPLPGV